MRARQSRHIGQQSGHFADVAIFGRAQLFVSTLSCNREFLVLRAFGGQLRELAPASNNDPGTISSLAAK
jgi:hypothetical protein